MKEGGIRPKPLPHSVTEVHTIKNNGEVMAVCLSLRSSVLSNQHTRFFNIKYGFAELNYEHIHIWSAQTVTVHYTQLV
jgi:hypothetical protein